MSNVNKMTEEELRVELRKIREERSGKGRVRKTAARTKRIAGQKKDTAQRQNIEAVEGAEWV